MSVFLPVKPELMAVRCFFPAQIVYNPLKHFSFGPFKLGYFSENQVLEKFHLVK